MVARASQPETCPVAMTKNANKRATGREPTFLVDAEKNDWQRSKNSSSRPPYANDVRQVHYGTLAISFHFLTFNT